MFYHSSKFFNSIDKTRLSELKVIAGIYVEDEGRLTQQQQNLLCNYIDRIAKEDNCSFTLADKRLNSWIQDHLES